MKRTRMLALIAAVFAAAALLSIRFFSAPVYSYDNEPDWFKDPAGKDVYVISDAKDFKAFVSLIDQGCRFSGKTVYLLSDITTSEGATGVFEGSFDGLGNTVTLEKKTKNALFESLDGAEIRNLTVASGQNYEVGVLQDECGGVVAANAVNTVFDGIRVTGSFSFSPQDDGSAGETLYSGAIAGYTEGSSFINCVSDIICMNTYGAFAGMSIGTSFENSVIKGTGYAVLDAEECIYSNLLSYLPVLEPSCGAEEEEESGEEEEIPGEGPESGRSAAEGTICLAYGEYTPEQAQSLLNAAAAEDGEYNPWELSGQEIVLHLHFAERIDTPAGCTTRGKSDYICGCGADLLTLDISPTGHTLTADGETVAPTCTEEGYTVRTCTVCGESVRTDILPAAGHITETVNKADATCVSKGYTGDEVCTVCGETVKTGKVTKATGIHDWSNTVVTKEPTGDESGEITYYCVNCDAVKRETIPPLGHVAGEWKYYDEQRHRADCSCGEDHLYGEHSWDKGRVTKEPTGDDPGERVYMCTVCAGTKSEVIPALGHETGPWKETDEEHHSAKCTCGETHTEPHDFDKGALISDGIEDQSGIRRTLFTCRKCGAQKVVEEEVLAQNETTFVPEDPSEPSDIRVDKKKYALIAVMVILLVGGVGATLFVRFSDKR